MNLISQNAMLLRAETRAGFYLDSPAAAAVVDLTAWPDRARGLLPGPRGTEWRGAWSSSLRRWSRPSAWRN